jgi:hypothetical protein
LARRSLIGETMHSLQNAHLDHGDEARAETVRGQLYDFEVVRIGQFDIIAPPEVSSAELRGIAAAFELAAILREERLAKEQPDGH